MNDMTLTRLVDDETDSCRLRVHRDASFGLIAVAEDALTSRSTRAQPTHSRTIWLTTAEAEWLRDALIEIVPAKVTT